MSRWKYKTATVTAGDNSQDVRMLTAGERKEVAEIGAKVQAGVMTQADVPILIATLGCINPAVSKEEAEAMPPDLLDAVCDKILKLTNLGGAEEKKADP